jgi:hypothetical protein
MSSPNVVWQRRSSRHRPAAIQHGIESVWRDSTAELLRIAKSATLLTRSGHEVIVNGLEEVGDGVWSGSVAKAAAGAKHIQLGIVVQFREEEVQGATLT